MQARLRAHSHWISLVALLIALLGGGYTITRPTAQPTPHPPPATADSLVPDAPIPTAAAGKCANTAALRAHTYNPQRLQLIQACTTIVGTVAVVRHEADGDLHVLLREDPGQPVLTNAINDAKQKGDLVIEPECDYSPLTQADAQASCQGAPRTPGANLLVVGAHVRVTGDYVLDLQHGWDEIHVVCLVEPA